jgi:hypothetical protein
MSSSASFLQGVEELAGVYCTWAEMEIRHENFEEALQVCPPPLPLFTFSLPPSFHFISLSLSSSGDATRRH